MTFALRNEVFLPNGARGTVVQLGPGPVSVRVEYWDARLGLQRVWMHPRQLRHAEVVLERDPDAE